MIIDETTGKLAFYPVVAIWVHKEPAVTHMDLDGELVETTPEHPFYTAKGKRG